MFLPSGAPEVFFDPLVERLKSQNLNSASTWGSDSHMVTMDPFERHEEIGFDFGGTDSIQIA